jgi:hypothetical protein
MLAMMSSAEFNQQFGIDERGGDAQPFAFKTS